MKKLSIALVSDMFYPHHGGVETHIMQLGINFIRAGHDVIIITHRYGDFKGVREINGLTVYYLDFPILYREMAWPMLFSGVELYKRIFEKHKVEIVHGHQSISMICLEAIYHASWLGLKTVLTDHSLFETGKIERVIVNSINRYVCFYVNRIICVSEAAKANTRERFGFEGSRYAVIPNGVDVGMFYLSGDKKERDTAAKIQILVVSRLEYRKGINLLVEALLLICQDPGVRVKIVGDGFMRDEIMGCIDQNDLHEQISMEGTKNQKEVGELMRESDIFLNTSLTESFCMVVLEAFSCGLSIVTTNVGGISEIKGIRNIFYCKPNGIDISAQITKAKGTVGQKRKDSLPSEYLWSNIADKTLKVYESIPLQKKKSSYDYYQSYPFIKHTFFRIAALLENLAIKISEFFEAIRS